MKDVSPRIAGIAVTISNGMRLPRRRRFISRKKSTKAAHFFKLRCIDEQTVIIFAIVP